MPINQLVKSGGKALTKHVIKPVGNKALEALGKSAKSVGKAGFKLGWKGIEGYGKLLWNHKLTTALGTSTALLAVPVALGAATIGSILHDPEKAKIQELEKELELQRQHISTIDEFGYEGETKRQYHFANT